MNKNDPNKSLEQMEEYKVAKKKDIRDVFGLEAKKGDEIEIEQNDENCETDEDEDDDIEMVISSSEEEDSLCHTHPLFWSHQSIDEYTIYIYIYTLNQFFSGVLVVRLGCWELS